MRKLVLVLVMVLSMLFAAVSAHAERGDIGGIGVKATSNLIESGGIRPTENGSIWPLSTVRPDEHEDIGGVGVRSVEKSATAGAPVRSLEHGDIGGVGVR